jgi:hypothetical protein
MLQKISYLGNELFQLDDNEIPVETTDIARLAIATGQCKTEEESIAFAESVKTTGEGNLQVEANKGVIVNIYEVDYPQPKNPRLETQELAGSVREERDFVTQYVYPSTEVEDVVVVLRKDLEDGGKAHTPKASKRGWRQVLSWKEIKEYKPGARVRVKDLPTYHSAYHDSGVRDGDEGTIVMKYPIGGWDIKFDNGRMYSQDPRIYIAIREKFLELI